MLVGREAEPVDSPWGTEQRAWEASWGKQSLWTQPWGTEQRAPEGLRGKQSLDVDVVG